jgi:metal-responsive CopG/Arc/MetJ family transcriptional regulator
MFGGGKVKLEKDLLDRLKKVSDTAGYATVEEFITHILEKELQQFEDAQSDEDIKNKLRGLGYIS